MSSKKLSEKQHELMGLICLGNAPKEIARIRQRSYGTITKDISRLSKALGARTIEQAVHIYTLAEL